MRRCILLKMGAVGATFAWGRGAIRAAIGAVPCQDVKDDLARPT